MKKSSSFATIPAMLLGIVLAIVMGVFSMPAFAVDANGAFELDANALESATLPGDDWQTLYGGGGSQTTWTEIIVDRGQSSGDDIFTGGGSKTPKDPENWLWKTDPPPPAKDDITNAYAANYMVGGEQIVYFGADLYADNGDAELAYWFFQNKVEANALGGFDGHHKNGDVYVAVKYSNGGKNATVTVYAWDDQCTKAEKSTGAGSCAAENIVIVVPAKDATCDGSGHNACAVTNQNDEISPWNYEPKDGVSKVFPPTTFFEGGINIFETFLVNKCFSSFMVTTGASTSFTAVAKDFALGDFDVCSVDVTKTCRNDTEDDDGSNGLNYNIRGCGINDGAASINLTTLLNSVPIGAADLDPSPTWYIPGDVDDGAGGLRTFDPDPSTDCSNKNLLAQAILNGTEVIDPTNYDLLAGEALVYEFDEFTTVNGVSDRVTLDAEGTDGADIDAATDTADCPVIEFPASLKVTKQCAADLEDAGLNVVVKINVEGTVCNTGKVQLTQLTLTDLIAGELVNLVPLRDTLEPGDPARTDGLDCTPYTGFYYPSSIPSGDICPFSDQVQAKAIAPRYSSGDQCQLLGDLTSECTADSNGATCNLRAVDDDGDCSTGPWSQLP